jgi:hypothetical protein
MRSKKGIFSQIEGFATNSCFFEANRTTLPYKGFRKGRRWNITNSDIPVIKEKVSELQYITPMLFSGGNEKNVVRGDKNGSYRIKGCYPEYDLIEKSKMLYGRYVNDIEIAEKRKVCVIGERIYEVLFQKGEDPTGKQVRVNGIYFQVVGVARSTSGVNIGGETAERLSYHSPPCNRLSTREISFTYWQPPPKGSSGKKGAGPDTGDPETTASGLTRRQRRGMDHEHRGTIQNVQLPGYRHIRSDMDRGTRHALRGCHRREQYHAGHRARAHQRDRYPPGTGSHAP